MPISVKISEIMNKDIFAVDITDNIKKAINIMDVEKVKHIPVVDETKIIGLITEHELLEYKIRRMFDFEEDNYEESAIISDLPHLVKTVSHFLYPEDSVRKAIQLMTKYKIDCLPVIDWEYNLLGIVTSVDLLLYLNIAIPSPDKHKEVV